MKDYQTKTVEQANKIQIAHVSHNWEHGRWCCGNVGLRNCLTTLEIMEIFEKLSDLKLHFSDFLHCNRSIVIDARSFKHVRAISSGQHTIYILWHSEDHACNTLARRLKSSDNSSLMYMTKNNSCKCVKVKKLRLVKAFLKYWNLILGSLTSFSINP